MTVMTGRSRQITSVEDMTNAHPRFFLMLLIAHIVSDATKI